MESIQLSIFIFLLICGFVSANNRCCETNELLLLRKNECWTPGTNVTTPITLKCNNTYRFRRNFFVNEDRKLRLIIGENFDETLDEDKYCVHNTTSMRDVTLTNITVTAIVCGDEEEEEILDDKVLGYCMIISVIFLVPTALIYSALPELRDVQGKSIINFCISLGIGQGILVIMKLMEYSDMALCATRGFLAYFFVIAAFFWANAIAIQVLLNTRRPSTLDYSWYEFKWYFLYAWGVPVVLTVAMAIVNFHPGKHAKPGLGLSHCWFMTSAQQWYYMYSVMTILLSINIGIFIYISIVIWKLTFSSTHLRALRYKFIMSVRLILLMGLPWVFEMVSSVAGQSIILTIIDVFNCLQGILIFFLLVVFRKRVLKMMYKHGWLDCISGFVEKHLAIEDDEENVVAHTDVPMTMSEVAK